MGAIMQWEKPGSMVLVTKSEGLTETNDDRDAELTPWAITPTNSPTKPKVAIVTWSKSVRN